MYHDKHSICIFLAHFVVALCHPPKVFSKCSLPHFCSREIVHQLFIAGYCFSSHRVYHGICVVFKVVSEWYHYVLHEVAGHQNCIECCFLLDGEYIYRLLHNNALGCL